VLRQLEVSEATWNHWRAQYGGMKGDEAKRLKQLEGENQRLKKLVVEQALDIALVGYIHITRFIVHRNPGWFIELTLTRTWPTERQCPSILTRS
jgi:Transposase